MWFSIIRFIGANLAALGVGYAASDFFRAVGPDNGAQDNKKPFYSNITDRIGLTRGTAAIVVIIALSVLAYKLGFLKNRK